MKCRRCGVSSFSDTAEVEPHIISIVLYGDYCTVLCDNCRNEWARYMMNHELWAHIHKLDAKSTWYNLLAKAGIEVQLSDIKGLVKKSDAATMKAYELAMRFVEEDVG